MARAVAAPTVDSTAGAQSCRHRLARICSADERSGTAMSREEVSNVRSGPIPSAVTSCEEAAALRVSEISSSVASVATASLGEPSRAPK